ncbi:DUF4340 domain-containing protein [Candidatus Omnitrophota bacterium]
MRKTVLSLFLLIALACYFFLVEGKKETEEQMRAVASMKLLDVPEGVTIDRIRISHGESSFEVEGKNGFWRIIDPVIEIGNTLILEGIEKMLRLQRKDKVLPEYSDDLSVYGLDPPEITIGVTLSSYVTSRNLLLGKKAPLEDLYYAMWQDGAEVFMLNANVRNALAKDLSEIRNRSIFSISQEDHIEKVECVSEVFVLKCSYEAEKNRWLIHEPFEELAKNEVMDDFLKSIKGIYIDRFLDGEDVEDSAFGITDNISYIKITTELNKEYVVRLGNLTDDKKHYYAHIEGRTSPVLISSEVLDGLRKDPNEFIERRIAPFQAYEVSTFSYLKGDNERVLERIDYEWHRDQEKIDEATEKSLDEFLGHLANIEYEIVFNDKGIEKFNLKEEDPLFMLTLLFEEPKYGIESIEFTFFSKKDGFFIKNSLDGNYYEISEENYKKTISFIEVLYD